MGTETFSYEEYWDRAMIVELNRRINHDDSTMVTKEYNEIMQLDILQTPMGNQYIGCLNKIMRREYDHKCMFCGKPSRAKTVLCEDCWKENEKCNMVADQIPMANYIVTKSVPGLVEKQKLFKDNSQAKKKKSKIIKYFCGAFIIALIALLLRALFQKPDFPADFANENITEQTFLSQYEQCIESNAHAMIGENMDIAFVPEGASLGGNAYTMTVNGDPIRAGVIVYCNDSNYVKTVMFYVAKGGRYMKLFELCMGKMLYPELDKDEIEALFENPGNYVTPSSFGENYVCVGDDNEMTLSTKDYYDTFYSRFQLAISNPAY